MKPPSPIHGPAGSALQRLERLCPMRYQEYLFGNLCLNIWTACDIDPLLNSLVEKESTHPSVLDERMPYWAELWPSSILLAETIAQRKNQLPKGVWLELGCGPGLPGIMAAKSGHSGIASDYMQEALWLTCLNAYQNQCADLIETRLLDWRTPPENLKVSWILAGDIVYESRNFPPLLEAFDKLLQPGGEIWLGEPGRSVAKTFFEQMKSLNWKNRVLAEKDGCVLYCFTRQ